MRAAAVKVGIAIDRVVSGAANQRVIARTAIDEIVAQTRINRVVAAPGDDHIVIAKGSCQNGVVAVNLVATRVNITRKHGVVAVSAGHEAVGTAGIRHFRPP